MNEKFTITTRISNLNYTKFSCMKPKVSLLMLIPLWDTKFPCKFSEKDMKFFGAENFSLKTRSKNVSRSVVKDEIFQTTDRARILKLTEGKHDSPAIKNLQIAAG